jgi:ribosomal protein L16 Arg81 hydroxylase
MSKQDFLSMLRQRKLAFLRASDPDRFRLLLDWQALAGQLERGEHPRGLADVRVVKESTTVHPERWMTRNKTNNTNQIDIAKVEEFMADGFSLVVTPIQTYVPPLAKLCENIKAELEENIKVGVVVTTGSCGAFRLHFDPEDIIILQVQGTKRWKIYGPPVPNPVIGIPKPPPPPEAHPLFDDVLQPGDLLFVPAGNWHHCENGPDRSLHLGIFCIAPTMLHVLKTFLSQFMTEEMFRIPLTRFEDGEDLAELEARAKARLIERVQHLEVKDYLSKSNKEKTSAAALES